VSKRLDHHHARQWTRLAHGRSLPGIIEYLRSQDYTLVTVSQLIGLQAVPDNAP